MQKRIEEELFQQFSTNKNNQSVIPSWREMNLSENRSDIIINPQYNNFI